MISRRFFTRPITGFLNYIGYNLVPIKTFSRFYDEDDPEMVNDLTWCKQYSMTTPERLVSLHDAVQYVIKNKIPGSIVECGVWKGGSMAMVAKTLIRMQEQERDLYLFDTFAGMSQPTSEDIRWDGQSAQPLWQENVQSEKTNAFCYASLEEVKNVLDKTKYNPTKIHYVQGKVEDTLPSHAPQTIALLRLDTDWYQSTRHELQHLFSRLSIGGVLIIDDYGCWKGAKKSC